MNPDKLLDDSVYAQIIHSYSWNKSDQQRRCLIRFRKAINWVCGSLEEIQANFHGERMSVSYEELLCLSEFGFKHNRYRHDSSFRSNSIQTYLMCGNYNRKLISPSTDL
jgi:hypothetical protein